MMTAPEITLGEIDDLKGAQEIVFDGRRCIVVAPEDYESLCAAARRGVEINADIEQMNRFREQLEGSRMAFKIAKDRADTADEASAMIRRLSAALANSYDLLPSDCKKLMRDNYADALRDVGVKV